MSLNAQCQYSQRSRIGRPRSLAGHGGTLRDRNQTGAGLQRVAPMPPSGSTTALVLPPQLIQTSHSTIQAKFNDNIVDTRDDNPQRELGNISDVLGPLQDQSRTDAITAQPQRVHFNGFEDATHLQEPAALEADTTLPNFGNIFCSGDCGCLTTAYLLLDELRAQEDIMHLERIQRLRRATQKAVAIVQCQICPLRFVSLSQNVSLVFALIFSILEAYRIAIRLVNESTGPIFLSSPIPERDIQSPLISAAIPPEVEMSGSAQWKIATKSVLRRELYGQLSQDHTFFSLLDKLESRQVNWHTIPPCDDFPVSCARGADKRPLCIVQCDEARQMARCLEL
jgi:hypothetical protein